MSCYYKYVFIDVKEFNVKKALVILFVVLLLGGTFAWDRVQTYFITKFLSHPPAPVVTVSTSTVKYINYQPTLTAVGSLSAYHGVQVTSQMPGQIKEILFKSGDYVKKGDALIQLDDSVAQQTLASDKAQLQYDEATYRRYQSLYKTHAVSRSDLETMRTQYQKTLAQVASDELNIKHMLISAPFSGKLGIRAVDMGQYINAGDALVSLQQLDPMYVDFTLPAINLPDLTVGQGVDVSLTSSSGTQTLSGKIEAINSDVNVNSRNINVRAQIANEQHKYLPGQYANVSVKLPEQAKTMVIPRTAITYSLFGDSVYLVKKDSKDDKKFQAIQQVVTVGNVVGDSVIVTKGLSINDQVVNAGQNKLKNGATVVINNSDTIE